MSEAKKNMVVCEIRGKVSYAGPGMKGYDAEARVEDEEWNKVYVHVNDYDGRHYTVSKTSVFDYMTGKESNFPEPVFDEEYRSLAEAKKSMYGKVFETLTKVVSRMENGLE